MTRERIVNLKHRREEAFADGVCAALAVVASYDAETCWREIVSTCGGYIYLRAISKRAGNLRMDGFTRYRQELAR